MSYDAYLVRLDPQDDNGYAQITRLASYIGSPRVKLLSPAEGDKVRELLLADEQLGKTVGVNGIRGEGYIVLSTFPKIAELHNFFRSVASEAMDNSEFYSLNAAKIAAAKTDVVSKEEGGFRRRRSLRKSSKRAQRKNSRGTKLR
jgi:GTP1/Obg family GTP-binding protein